MYTYTYILAYHTVEKTYVYAYANYVIDFKITVMHAVNILQTQEDNELVLVYFSPLIRSLTNFSIVTTKKTLVNLKN